MCYVVSHMGVPPLPAVVPSVWFCMYQLLSETCELGGCALNKRVV
jgi:hypothetical protein